jgi:hypothetical protein
MVLAACFGPRHPKNSSFLVFERIRCAEEALQFLACAGRKMADVLQIGLERGAVWYRKHAVVSLLLALLVCSSSRMPTGRHRNTTPG